MIRMGKLIPEVAVRDGPGGERVKERCRESLKNESGHRDHDHEEDDEPRGKLFAFRPSEQGVRATEPLVIFTDAILAIAATILVADLAIPATLGPNGLHDVLSGERTTFYAVFLGYLWLASSWINTRRLRRMLIGIDHYATVLYLLMIFTITMIPFAMLALARTLGQPDVYLGVQVLAILSLADGVIVAGLLSYACWRGLGNSHMTRDRWREVLVPNYILMVLDLVAVVLARWIPWPVFVFICCDWLYALLPLFTDREHHAVSGMDTEGLIQVPAGASRDEDRNPLASDDEDGAPVD